MEIFVVIGVYSGCIDYSKAWANQIEAEKDLAKLKTQYGIAHLQEAESPHAAELHKLHLHCL